MAEYRFSTTWRVDARLAAVWDAIYQVDRWPDWWKGAVRTVELEPGDARGVGALHRYTWKGALPYRLTFDMRVRRVERPYALEGHASGAIEGDGRWSFVADGARTVVRYDWHIRTHARWMNWLEPLARPLFRWNHDVVMREGAKGLARRLGAAVETDGRTFRPLSGADCADA
ncbi:SRPBCC family protein [Burkholderia cenocepacia]|uniref:SRPBCC family protein n=1 Tax=Burkholderia cenocepacia TaxID=95486 RepID=A0ABD4UIU2_9BURK|nr:SRPBCC family protein [Burkholderia cenocepacia]MBR7943652.1 SRPBCC family protein [Burkholderia cenocepacia]MCW3697041.1 SRPBCC family protein [Burkholderia cenocepacia]MCW3704774.1 SRPBCC family protein [Burkholderia cenocepacia]MCW3714124.1 SRPBCC family protein [Burkholderia cenocepacia]MCW3725460.1 SRPBCC family protein [Burkholderia cenocepacia]